MKQSLKILAICFKIFFLFAPLATGQSALSGKGTESHKGLTRIQLNLTKITEENTNIFQRTILTEQKGKTLPVSREVMLSEDPANINQHFAAAAPSEAESVQGEINTRNQNSRCRYQR
jgi:hypothetical protein